MKIRYKAGYKYQLYETYSIQTDITPLSGIKTAFIRLTADGILTINSGYAWDGPSGPTIDTLNSMRASLVHDALYQLHREQRLEHQRRKSDRLFYKILKEDGMWKFRAKIWYRSVRRWAKRSSVTGRKVLMAP